MADRYLVATGVFSSTAIWSATSGGAGGASVPGASDTIILDTNSSGFACTLDQAVSVVALDMQSGTGTIDTSGTSYSFTVSAGFAIASGEFTANASAISVGTNCLITGGTFNGDTSTVSLVGSGNLYNAIAGNAFSNLTQVGAITTTATGDVYINGLFTTSNTGTVTDDGGGTRDIHIDGVLVVGGVTWVSVGTLALWFGLGTTIPGDDYGNINLRVRLGSTGTVTMGGDVTTTNGVIVASTANDATSTLDTGGFDFSCAVLQLGASGQISRGGELAVTGISTVIITTTLTAYADNGTQVNGITVAASGTNGINIGGDWIANTGATMDLQDSTTMFNGSGAQSITSGGEAFANVIINKSGGTATLQDALVCNTFTHTGGSFDDGGLAVTVAGTVDINTAGSYAFSGTWTQTGDANFVVENNGTPSIASWDVVLQGTGGFTIDKPGYSIASLTCAAAGKVTTVTGATINYTGTVTLGTGTFTLNTTLTWNGSGSENTPIVTAGATFNGAGSFNLVGRHAGLISIAIPALTITGSVNLFLSKASGDGVCTYNLGILSVSYLRTHNATDSATAGVVVNTGGNAITATVDWSFGTNTANGPFTLNAGASAVSVLGVGTLAYNGAGGTTVNMGTSAWTVTGNWTTQSNHTISASSWSLDLGGSGTQDITSAGEPFATVDVTGTSTVELQDAFTCTDFTLITGTFDTNSVGSYAMTVTTFDMNGGTFLANASAIGVGGNCTITSGTFTKGTSTVTLTASGNLLNATLANEFNDLTQGAGIITTMTGIVYVNGAMVAGVGSTIRTDGTSRTLILDGTLTVNTVTWSGNGATLTILTEPNMSTLPGDDYGDAYLSIRRTNSGVTTLSGPVITTGRLYLLTPTTNQTSKVDSGGFALTCGSLLIGVDGSTSRGGRLTLSGNSPLTVNGDTIVSEANGSTAWSEIIVSTGGTSVIDFNGNVTLRTGVGTGIDAQAASITVFGNWLNQGAYFTGGTSLVDFDGAAAQTVTSAGKQFYDVDVTNSHASGVTFADAMDSQGTLTFNSTASAVRVDFDETGAHVWTDVAQTGGNGVTLRSEVDTNQWDVTLANPATLLQINVKDSNLGGANIDVTDPSNTDSGNNSVNWQFVATTSPKMYYYRRHRS